MDPKLNLTVTSYQRPSHNCQLFSFQKLGTSRIPSLSSNRTSSVLSKLFTHWRRIFKVTSLQTVEVYPFMFTLTVAQPCPKKKSRQYWIFKYQSFLDTPIWYFRFQTNGPLGGHVIAVDWICIYRHQWCCTTNYFKPKNSMERERHTPKHFWGFSIKIRTSIITNHDKRQQTIPTDIDSFHN